MAVIVARLRHLRMTMARGQDHYEIRIESVTHLLCTVALFYGLRNHDHFSVPSHRERSFCFVKIHKITEHSAECPRSRCWTSDGVQQSGGYELYESPNRADISS
nr:hypothetical protein CFP56_07437 [Quercus suber]